MGFTTDRGVLVYAAAEALLNRKPVQMELPEGWKRPRNFPLPLVAHKDSNLREYRPLAILEWVDEQFRNEETGERTSQMHRQEGGL